MYLTQGLHRSLQQTPDHIATSFRGRRHTFREFGDRIARLASGLRGLGMSPGDRIGMLALNSDRYLEYVMGVLWGGGVLNPVNIRWSVPEIVYSLDDCDTRILIVDDKFLHMVDDIRRTARHLPQIIYAGEGPKPAGMLSFEELIAGSEPVEDAWRGGEDLAVIMYTGGTTGFPKGVMQTHLNLWSSCLTRMASSGVVQVGRLLHAAPLFHVGAMSRALWHFISGDTHVVIPMFEPVEMLQTIEREAISEIGLVPTMLQMLISHPDFGNYDLSSLRRLTYGASPISTSVLEHSMTCLPGVKFIHSYGLTEACPIVSYNPPENHEEAGRKNGLSRSAGRAVYGVTVKIVDDDGQEVPRGTVGEIIVRGPNIMAGYWNKLEETARALRDGWLHTGDGAYMDEQGYLFIVDRMKDMIVSGGENVYSAEVENVISRHPAVAMCAVIGIPHERWGEAVHAVVVRKPGAEVSEEALRAYCRDFIAAYKCPKTVEFRTELPLSGAAKVLKHELRAPYWKGKTRAVN